MIGSRVFVRRDVYGRFYSCLIFLPRENYNTDVRMKIQEILKRHLHGTSTEFTVHLSEAVLARILVERRMLRSTLLAMSMAFSANALSIA